MVKMLFEKKCKLKIPTGYIDIDRNEFEYIDGGYRASRSVYINPGSKRMSTVMFTAQWSAVNLIAAQMVCVVASALAPVTASINQWATNIYTGIAGTLVAERAKQLDAADGVVDGQLTVSWGGRYVTEFNPYPPNSYQGAIF